MPPQPNVLCIGAGPAGLTAAYKLAQQGIRVSVLEKDASYVGGISRTVWHDGFGIDIGGHRFFSKSAEINAFWQEILGKDFLLRPRKSRIYFDGKFYPYPLELRTTLDNLGIIESGLCVLSYLKRVLLPHPQANNFESWVSNQFGDRLYQRFFKTYTEKVWGVSCKELSADWAQQRIKGLSLAKALKNALLSAPKDSTTLAKTLIKQFYYPPLGPGMMWERVAEKVTAMNGNILMDANVEQLTYDAKASQWHIRYTNAKGESHSTTATHVISSMPLSQLVHITPSFTPEAKEAATGLSYRDFLIVGLVVPDRQIFDDNWLYIHDPDKKVGRIQHFKSWSPHLVPDETLNCYGMEYFCNETDALWQQSDAQLISLATQELEALGLARKGDVQKGFVVRQRKAYPVYDHDYKQRIAHIKTALNAHCPNLQVIGRNGMHKYNNQDHSMMTAILAAKNIIAGDNIYNVWHVNEDAEYHEIDY